PRMGPRQQLRICPRTGEHERVGTFTPRPFVTVTTSTRSPHGDILIMITRLRLFALLSTATVASAQPRTPSKWSPEDGNYTIKDFHFKDGETIPELKLHYLTLGKPHRDAA